MGGGTTCANHQRVLAAPLVARETDTTLRVPAPFIYVNALTCKMCSGDTAALKPRPMGSGLGDRGAFIAQA
eukprot:10343-Heterococcus_DN1.PRE.6